MPIKKWLKRQAEHILHKGWPYFLQGVLLITIGLFLGDKLGSLDLWIGLTYKLYQAVHELNPRKASPQRTVFVLIGDEEYWGKGGEFAWSGKGDLARRVPINRTYLAEILRALEKFDPAVIAFDFDLRSPAGPDGSLIENPQYQDETQDFLNAVKEVHKNRKVVLPATVNFTAQNKYKIDPSIFVGAAFDTSKVLLGYINLPPDVRRVPLRLNVGPCAGNLYRPFLFEEKGECYVDSFSLAIARADNKDRVRDLEHTEALPYGSYIRAEDFCQVSANTLLRGALAVQKDETVSLPCQIAHSVVIVGGQWSRWAYQRGERIDSYLTPVGKVGGVFIHANYIEALLDKRTFAPLAENFHGPIELVLACLVFLVFSLDIRLRVKVMIVTVFLSGMAISLYVFLFNIGMFFDFFTPIVLLLLHACFERIKEWRDLALSRELSNGRIEVPPIPPRHEDSTRDVPPFRRHEKGREK
ncbi:MAG: CHASE2 domain-containing protein [Deltaproteobacteria bacterium]|nr:CHASE2 domain-containing protein [Deltaproteobacteria bacterium]